jgi:hypothetical protein
LSTMELFGSGIRILIFHWVTGLKMIYERLMGNGL